MRLLVLDDSPLLAWTVARLSPAGTVVTGARSLDEAIRLLEEAAPDAVVVSVPPATLPWPGFQQLCASRHPPVPVLYLSCLFESTTEAGFDPKAGRLELLRKPVEKVEFEAALGRLFAAAREARSGIG